MLEKDSQKSKELEALLFIYGEAMPIPKIEKLLELTSSELTPVLESLKERLRGSGLMLLSHHASFQLVTRPEHATLVNEIVKMELNEELTPATLETLAIILYIGPVSRARVDYIRGVNSTFILRNLLLRGLVERSLDPERQNVFLYTGSVNLVRHLGLSQLQDLPDFAKYKEKLSQIKMNLGEETLTP